MWLPPEHALACCAATTAYGVTARRRAPRSSAAAREAALVFLLYALWRIFDGVDVHLEGGQRRGLQVWHLERALGLGTERWLQQQILGWPVVVQAANIYYAVWHAPAVIALLVWLYFRHRDSYAHWRSVLAISTGADVLIRLVPVAPPRLIPQLNFVDTAALYHQSVYGRFGAGVSDQLAAMPSIHAGWALLVGVAAWRVSTSRWRWIAVAHAVLTLLSVVVTANHWWLDCIVAALILVPISWAWPRLIELVHRRIPRLRSAAAS